MSEVDFCIKTARAENVIVQFKLHDGDIYIFSGAINFPAIKLDFPPICGKCFPDVFNIAFAGSPVTVKICRALNLAFFALAEFAQDGGARFSQPVLAVQSDTFFPDGKSSHLPAVREIEMDFAAFDKRFAVNRFTNRRIWYIIIPAENKSDKIFRADLVQRIINI